MTDASCPNCSHRQHLPGTECDARIEHGPNRMHLCLCLARPGAALSCPPQMDCRGGTLGYADIWYLQHGHSLIGVDGAISPEVLKTSPAPVAPAGELRAAVEKLRKLATQATAGPWIHEVSPVYGFRVGTASASDWVAFTGDYADEPDESGPDAAFIAAMHPGVGLALVGWLAGEAEELEHDDFPGIHSHALAVARQINGTAS